MARKQAKRRKPKTARKWSLPTIRVGRIITPLIAVGIVAATYQLSAKLLERPIETLEVSGPFQRVSAMEIEAAIGDSLDAGFFSTDIANVRERLQALAWVDQATVARRWPDRLAITVTEQSPAAVWGDSGLLNVRGELFVANAERLPAELPRLSGPEQHAGQVARRYLQVRERLIPIGLDLRRVDLDARGSWEMTLSNGVIVRLGRRDVAARTALFLDTVANVITSREAEIDYVDMRYSNGFAIGWKDGAPDPDGQSGNESEEMLALRGER